MSLIEDLMVQAVYTNAEWARGNTRVTHNVSVCTVYLHENRIAEVDTDADKLRMDRETFNRWPTQTTKSRLRALGFNMCRFSEINCIDGFKYGVDP